MNYNNHVLIDTYFIRAVARQGRDSLIAQKRNLGDCVDESARLDPLAHDTTPRKKKGEKKSSGTQCDSCAKIMVVAAFPEVIICQKYDNLYCEGVGDENTK